MNDFAKCRALAVGLLTLALVLPGAEAAAKPKQTPLPATGMTVAGPGLATLEEGQEFRFFGFEPGDFCLNLMSLGPGEIMFGSTDVPPQGLNACGRWSTADPGFYPWSVSCVGPGDCTVAWRIDRFVTP